MTILKRAAAIAAALTAAAAITAPANAATAKTPVPSAPGTAQTTYDITNSGNGDSVLLSGAYCANGAPFVNAPTSYTPLAFWVNADGSWSFTVPGCGTNPRECIWNVSGGLEADPCDTSSTQDKWWANHDSNGNYWFKVEGVGCDWYSWNTWYLQLPCTSWKGNNNLWYFR